MTRKRIIFLGIFIAVVALAAIFFSLKPGTKPGVVPQPAIPKNLQGEVSITPKFTEVDFEFPTSAPLLTVGKASPLTEMEANEISQKLGFSGAADKVEDAFDGTTYFWNGPDNSLIVYSKSRKIEYSINDISRSANKQLSDAAIIDIAKRFLSDKGLLTDNEYDFSFFTFMKESSDNEGISIVSKASAQIYQVNFSPKVSDTKLLTLDPKVSPIYVWVLPDGRVAKASVIRLGTITKSETNYPLKSYQQVISSLNQATVVSLDDGNINLLNISAGDLKNIDISEIDLAYLLTSATADSLQPIYTLKGITKIEGITSGVNAYVYLPAIKNPD